MEQNSDCPVLISNTHKDIYEFAVTMMSSNGSAELQVTNVDMHHAIFLCRSDVWLPPHLDQPFNDIAEFIKGQFTNVQIRPCVTAPREYKEAARKIAKTSKAIRSKNDKTKQEKENAYRIRLRNLSHPALLSIHI